MRSGSDGVCCSWKRFGFESIFHLSFELFETNLFLFELHLHVELSFLHVEVFLTGLLQFFLHLTDHRLFLLNYPVQSSLLSFLLRKPLSVALRVSQLLFELFDGFLIFLEMQHFILQEDVLFSRAGDLLFVFSHGLQ